MPGNRAVVHHVLAGIDDPGSGERQAIRGQMGELGGNAPGKNAIPYPTDTGILLRKEASFRFQMHYTPNGKATTDVTRLGLYFYERPPKHSMQMDIIYDASLAIPASTKSYSQTLDKVFDRDVMLYSLLPHAHLRGRAARFTAHRSGHELGQFRAESRQSRSEQGRTLGRPDLGGNERRLVPVSQRGRRRSRQCCAQRGRQAGGCARPAPD